MFHSALVRLTLWYLLIIMALSLLFSLLLYQVSTAEFNRELQRATALQNAPYFAPRGFAEFSRLRTIQIEESKQHIRFNLLYFNLVILAAGGTASYFLAKRTLQPIEAALEAQNRFTADASHELRTPLTAMKAEIEVALRDTSLSLKNSKELLQSNLEEVNKLQSLVNGLLTLAHSRKKPTLHDQVSLSVGDLITLATTKVAPLAKKKDITIDVSGQSGEITGDQQKLVELMTILLDNAIKYSPAKTIIHVRTHLTPKSVTIEVQDQGEGIATGDIPYIFDRFYRSDTSRTKQRHDGYGLGLAIAKQIVESHQGKIVVESTRTQGSVFRVTLPIQPKNS